MNLAPWMTIGVGLGVLGGTFVHNIPIGIVVGIAVSLAVGSLVAWAGGGKA